MSALHVCAWADAAATPGGSALASLDVALIDPYPGGYVDGPGSPPTAAVQSLRSHDVTFTDEDRDELRVIDHGPGMPDDHRDRVRITGRWHSIGQHRYRIGRLDSLRTARGAADRVGPPWKFRAISKNYRPKIGYGPPIGAVRCVFSTLGRGEFRNVSVTSNDMDVARP